VFFLLIGVRDVERLVAIVGSRCPNCGVDAPQRYSELGTRITLFLLPLLTYGRRTVRECSNCGWTTRVGAAEVEAARRRSTSGTGRY